MKIKALLCTLLAVVVTSVAHAGYQQPAGLFWEDGEGYTFVGGDLATVRFSDDDEAFIGCGIRAFADGYEYAFCQAGSSERAETLMCFTGNPDMIAKLRHLNDTSYLGFSSNDAGDCVHIATSTQSFYLRGGKDSKK